MMENDDKPHWKATLSYEEARDIYSKRPQGKSDSALIISSTVLSNRYKISPKAVRDIWNKRTWIKATQSMWTREEFETFLEKASKKQSKKPGRPVGAKDSKPRKKRSNHSAMNCHTSMHVVVKEEAQHYEQASYQRMGQLSSSLSHQDESSSAVTLEGYVEDETQRKSHDQANGCTICEAIHIFSDADTEQRSLQHHGHIIEFLDHSHQQQDIFGYGEDAATSEIRNVDINIGYPINLATEYVPLQEI
ncbi:hypothetical protein GUITHDRAFT_165933 [Guillardia theta CCMP2712]|uniref:Uncharacterized protein n=2 Tax=Guillardia theta TaxID=55529 RepID=L1IHH4_GUITC|nr:hypothetical protein GUITHDRAFT_165933 [Guillardia theta CCMP2712]EKX35547.1 hypothetical protein GUITHDRAFT_165933 [Guillardia theta CCMP2712]|mmetsp:Transcript_40574/g.127908  ORF Transcript_40574/g.127908 Transcript_40574/m.127908 type:complete len:248 (+) Transcript_40574:432-1175(+)|eukprot:XP_005822527.1 hypothetical protein GUITHDRAFT_165933 [Guillardia theta CCMP2712]